jgi:hypothetical protein
VHTVGAVHDIYEGSFDGDGFSIRFGIRDGYFFHVARQVVDDAVIGRTQKHLHHFHVFAFLCFFSRFGRFSGEEVFGQRVAYVGGQEAAVAGEAAQLGIAFAYFADVFIQVGNVGGGSEIQVDGGEKLAFLFAHHDFGVYAFPKIRIAAHLFGRHVFEVDDGVHFGQAAAVTAAELQRSVLF